MRKRVTLSAVVAGLALAGAARANLLYNGDFNVASPGGGGPDGWSSWSWNGNNNPATGNNYAGYKTDGSGKDASPYINAGNAGDWFQGGAGWYQVVPGAAGVTYTLSSDSATEGWDNAAGEMRLIFLDASSNVLVQNVGGTANYEAGKPWAAYTMSAVAPAGTTQVKAEFATWGARGTVMWDNAVLDVPEPACLGLIALVAPLFLRGRRGA